MIGAPGKGAEFSCRCVPLCQGHVRRPKAGKSKEPHRLRTAAHSRAALPCHMGSNLTTGRRTGAPGHSKRLVLQELEMFLLEAGLQRQRESLSPIRGAKPDDGVSGWRSWTRDFTSELERLQESACR